MTVERPDQRTDHKHHKHAFVRLDSNNLDEGRPDEGRPDELKEPLEFASMRLRKKVGVRHVIQSSRVQSDSAPKDEDPTS